MMVKVVAVGTAVARRPPHGSRRAELPHRALALDDDGQTVLGIRLTDSRVGKPARGDATHGRFVDPPFLASAIQCPMPEPPPMSDLGSPGFRTEGLSLLVRRVGACMGSSTTQSATLRPRPYDR